MKKKLRQISDTIHQTVYLSELESNLMSTAYFYRLHDVYQSSTVYLTFPSNRTKRYEHSLGTMELAGEMFFSAVTNASVPTLDSFFKEAEKHFQTVVKRLLEGSIRPTYVENAIGLLRNCFSAVSPQNMQKDCEKVITAAYENFEQVEDVALDHYLPPFSTKLKPNDLKKTRFLYQCLLESVRIVALFHDIGHPPYSHIMEDVLNELYDACKTSPDKFNSQRSEELINNLKPFKEAENDSISCLLSVPLKVRPQLHEQVGLKMLSGAISDILQSKLALIEQGKNKTIKGTIALYYVTVAEFCFAILREQNPFFISLHRIIDGCVDADRMDYIVRDSHNSGVDWGSIPYKRMLESCKLMERDQGDMHFYPIAFPKKMAEHIDDLLITRYKIFSRINFHHRSYKTALILQRLVKLLSEDYLKKEEDKKVLCPGINDLWNCLSSTLNSGDLYIIQWNDSTLTSHLYQTLTEVKRGSFEDYGISEEEYDEVSNMLEEFLLNRKHFFSIFKRQSDFSPIFNDIFAFLKPLVNQVKEYEQEKLANSISPEATGDVDDSLKRLDVDNLDGIIKSGDADALERIFPSEYSLRIIIKTVLEDFKTNDEIASYLFAENKKRAKTGLPELDDLSDGIFLYEYDDDKPILYNISILENQLVQLQNNCLQYIAYVQPVGDGSKTIEKIRKSISNQLCKALQQSMQENFSCLRK